MTSFLLALTLTAACLQVKLDTRIFNIRGNQPMMVNSSLNIRPGDHLLIRASGRVCFSGTETLSCIGPEGYPRSSYAAVRPYDDAECEDPLSCANHAMLIDEIDRDRFLIGAEETFDDK